MGAVPFLTGLFRLYIFFIMMRITPEYMQPSPKVTRNLLH
jgi:hypothetical protein